jgi:hypothetical protein
MRSMRGGWCGVVAVAGLLLGCCGPRGGQIQTYPVTGHLFVGDKPAVGARVQLNAVGDVKLLGLCPHATVEPDGSFRLTTFKTNDGAPAGTYALTVTWPSSPRPGQEEGPDRFRGRYADPRRPLREVQITAGENALGVIHLN